MKKPRLTTQLAATICACLISFALHESAGMAQGPVEENTPATPLIAPFDSTTIQSASSTSGDAEAGTFAEQMIVLVNQLRQQNSLPPIKLDPTLTSAAQAYAVRLSAGNFFGHLDPDFNCNKPADRAVAAGYNNWAAVGENIAAGYPTPLSAVDAFANSAGHRANMLNPAYRDIGAGFVLDENDQANVRQNGNCPYSANNGGPYRFYWTQLFGARWRSGMPVLPVIINSEAVSTAQRQVTLYIYGGLDGQPIWAKQMRFSEDNVNWTAYEPWSPTKSYTLSAGAGVKTVYVQLSNGAATQTSSDSIKLTDNSSVQPQPAPTNLPARAFVPLVIR
jgi:uncharacterized protein YkwD